MIELIRKEDKLKELFYLRQADEETSWGDRMQADAYLAKPFNDRELKRRYGIY